MTRRAALLSYSELYLLVSMFSSHIALLSYRELYLLVSMFRSHMFPVRWSTMLQWLVAILVAILG